SKVDIPYMGNEHYTGKASTHNHPSGSVEPSTEDIDLTRQLLKGALLLNIPLLDHVILGNGNFQSLREITTLWDEYPQGDI
ncbi:JAB domain-containing protein, partial [Dulcicalothrix desertica]|uniref:JAB domain-containing protein n=1 Tax=Dulcicalothrix desertica TaxID=32056 RepID=UPI002D77DC57